MTRSAVLVAVGVGLAAFLTMRKHLRGYRIAERREWRPTDLGVAFVDRLFHRHNPTPSAPSLPGRCIPGCLRGRPTCFAVFVVPIDAVLTVLVDPGASIPPPPDGLTVSRLAVTVTVVFGVSCVCCGLFLRFSMECKRCLQRFNEFIRNIYRQ